MKKGTLIPLLFLFPPFLAFPHPLDNCTKIIYSGHNKQNTLNAVVCITDQENVKLRITSVEEDYAIKSIESPIERTRFRAFYENNNQYNVLYIPAAGYSYVMTRDVIEGKVQARIYVTNGHINDNILDLEGNSVKAKWGDLIRWKIYTSNQ